MKRYQVSFKYSNDGKFWTGTSIGVNAESDIGAIEQVKSKYPYVKDIRIIGAK